MWRFATASTMVSSYCNVGSSIECVKLLIDADADLNSQNNERSTALMMASINCNIDPSIELNG